MNSKDLNITPDQVARMVAFTYGKTVKSEPFWCFVAVKPSRYDELQRLVSAKTFDINNFEKNGFGEIVVSGEGVMPPNDVILTVSKMFNVPVRDFFKPLDMDAEIAKEIERIKKELDQS